MGEEKTVINTASGKTYVIEGGYLDIGILDTMKDLLVNFIGAVVFCSAGYAFLKYGENKKVASTIVEGLRLQPADRPEEEDPETEDFEAEEDPKTEEE